MTMICPQREYHMFSRWEDDTGRIFVHKWREVTGEISKRGVFIIYNATVGKQL